ncbi:MAG: 2,3-bisphosphoglycerate-independent phosphoglycerate mutase [Actinobacteria bacterium]|nr:2,3-bisphosphoglycerate-independent phosphoglycerate mutase [Actinomycetota bacterium]
MRLTSLLNDATCHILLVVLDGLGGFADAEFDTELEQADTPNLDQLAAEGVVGLTQPAGAGITAGSGPGHLALFGYDPTEYELGRGVLSATGVEFDLQPGDIAARGNLCTLDDDGNVADRRAGRIADDRAQALTDALNEGVKVDGAEVMFRHISSHRVLAVLRGEGLDHRIADLDPQKTGVPPKDPQPLDPEAEHTASVLRDVDAAIRDVLADQDGADALLLRGFDTHHDLPSFADRYKLRAATVAIYPMYRGVAKLCGMDTLPRPDGLSGQVAAISDHWDDYDFFFLHHKKPDEAGHDGKRDEKVAAIEALDAVIPDLVALQPDVIAVTGDHSSPTQLSAHSWHPVPTLLWGPHVGRDDATSFGERACTVGLLGQRPTQELMPIMLASAGKLEKYGA